MRADYIRRDLRVTEEEYAKIKMAAGLLGVSMSRFVIDAALGKAMREASGCQTNSPETPDDCKPGSDWGQ